MRRETVVQNFNTYFMAFEHTQEVTVDEKKNISKKKPFPTINIKLVTFHTHYITIIVIYFSKKIYAYTNNIT